MTETLILPTKIGISFGSALSSQARVLRAQFGSQYVQRQGDGLNPINRKYSVQFVHLLISEAQYLDDFFRRHGGWEAFYYTVVGDVSPKLWVCSEWTRSHVDARIDSMTANWEEVFVP